MRDRTRFALRVAMLWAVTLAVPVATGAALVAASGGSEREVLMRVLAERAPLLVAGALFLLGVSVALVHWLHTEYVSAARALTEQTRIVLSVNEDMQIESEGAPELAELAAAIARLADERSRLRQDFEARAGEARARLEEERNRLAALMSELAEGVLVCNTEGRILLYNEQARALFAGTSGQPGSALVGLGRSIFTLIDRDQLAHTLESLEQALQRGDKAASARFVAPAGSGKLIKFEAAAYLADSTRIAGMVFTLSDVTGMLEHETQRLALLETLARRVRAPVANIRAAAESVVRYPDMEATRRTRFIEIIATESLGLSQSIHDALRSYGDALKASLTLEDMRAGDLLTAAGRRIRSLLGLEVDFGTVDEDIWLRVDSFAFVQLLVYLASKLSEDYQVRSVRLSVQPAAGFAELDLAWRGAIVSHDALMLWESEPMRVGSQETPLTLLDVLERHGGEAWLHREGPAGERTACIRFLLPVGEPRTTAGRPARSVQSRPEFYDFDLFAHSAAAPDMQDRKLAELAYTVFDTETTGLEPSAGDEIISIGAVRIVNARLLKGEVFEQLVDPRRPLNPQSSRIHGIAAAALKGQPVIEKVLPAFHRFCEDTVLVAHNAAFDMRFLQLKEAAAGVRFHQAVLDTLLLSAVAHPDLVDHRLESVAERLGVPVIGRHTALGDALVAGEVFLRLLTLLAERGIVTLRQALDASRETYYARLQY
jgi:DNA polymerase III subunit epsilon